ncbi:MAG: hypothetical protein J6F30_01085 [Cellulosilyticum sp.]|nr:hypothetical protein [Cellulosilyticum sp.]
MKTKQLKGILKTLNSVIKSNKTEPITQLVFLYNEGSELRFGATNLSTSIIAKLEDTEVKLTPVTISLEDLFAVVKSIKDAECTFKQIDNGIQLIANQGIYTFPIVLENNRPLQLPLKFPEVVIDTYTPIKKPKIIKARNGMALGEGILSNYFCTKNSIITTNEEILAVTYVNTYTEAAILPEDIFRQLSCLGDEVNFKPYDYGFIFHDSTYLINTSKRYLKYPYETIAPFVGLKGTVPMPKDDLQRAFQQLHDLKKPVAYIGCDGKTMLISDDSNALVVGIPVNGKLTSDKIQVRTDTVLKALKTMEDNILIDVCEQYVVLSDDVGCFIVSRSE